jgi:hypothetical protein
MRLAQPNDMDGKNQRLYSEGSAMTMEAVIKEYRIEAIWHFTDRANLDSIREHGGLFSLKQLEEKGIADRKSTRLNSSH